ncbi:ATP-dependent DNA helicase PIF1-like protein [Tanacetum coccineum]
MFLQWMETNKTDDEAREITYAEFPTKYVWNFTKRVWTRGKSRVSIGRIHNVPISAGDAFYCRKLLNHIPGARSHDELKTIDDVVYPTYKEACYAMGLLEDDKEYIEAIKESNLVVTDEEKKNVALFYIEELMRSRGSSLQNFEDMPYPDEMFVSNCGNRLLYDELDYDPSELQRETGGRTAHSRFNIPINIDELSTCSINPQNDLAALSYPSFQKQSRQDIVGASLKESYLWDHCKVLRLTANIRLIVGCRPEDVNEIKDFVEWILKLGDGNLGDANNGEAKIDILDEMIINDSSDPVGLVIDFTYPNMLDNLDDNKYFTKKAILSPTNEVVDTINDKMLKVIPGEQVTYYSCDSVCKSEKGANINERVFSTE